MPDVTQERRCTTCQRSASEGAVFGVDRSHPKGRSKCNACLSARSRALYRAKQDEIREKARQRYHADPARRAKERGWSRAARQRHRERNTQKPPPLPPEWQCITCKRRASEGIGFYRDFAVRSGWKSVCAECRRQRLRRAYYADVQVTRARRGKYAARNRERLRHINRRYRGRHAERLRWEARRKYWGPDHDRQLVKRRVRSDLTGGWGDGHLSLDETLPSQEGRSGETRRDLTAAAGPDPAQTVLSTEERVAAWGWLSTLPAADQELLSTYADCLFNVEETASVLGLDPDEAGSRLSELQRRARREIATDTGTHA